MIFPGSPVKGTESLPRTKTTVVCSTVDKARLSTMGYYALCIAQLVYGLMGLQHRMLLLLPSSPSAFLTARAHLSPCDMGYKDLHLVLSVLGVERSIRGSTRSTRLAVVTLVRHDHLNRLRGCRCTCLSGAKSAQHCGAICSFGFVKLIT